ncbi:uncharacterized protein L201_002888 [Kwoniella dendrophila CBS 6074]|uniref:Uncharacterized protein n=1 Tax=Kwoniella dendrophila CBS 6074 TaxID=1295534 RepID=A0AAX4JRF9_9TREE
MKTSTSFAILALLASAGTSIAAPLPHHSTHKDSAKVELTHPNKGHHHARAAPANASHSSAAAAHPMMSASASAHVDMKMSNGKHATHHARADPILNTKSFTGAIGLPTADNLGNNGGKNGHKMGKTKGNSNNNQPLASVTGTTVNVNKVLNPTSNNVHSALKPLNSEETKVGQQLNHPNSGDVGKLSKQVDSNVEPQETQVSKNVLPRDDSNVVGTVTNSNGITKPIQTSATGITKNVASVNGNTNNNNKNPNGLPLVGSQVQSVTKGNNQILPTAAGVNNVNVNSATATNEVIGQEVKSVTSGTVALPKATTTLLNQKGGLTDLNSGPLRTLTSSNGGLVGTAGKIVTGTTGTLLNGNAIGDTTGSLLNGGTTKTVTGTVGKVPNTVGQISNGANVDPLSNQAYQLNTDGTESDVKSYTGTQANKAQNNGPNQTNKKVNALAFQGNGTTHRADPHPANGSREKTTQLISDNTNTSKIGKTTTSTANSNTSNNGLNNNGIVGVNSDSSSKPIVNGNTVGNGSVLKSAQNTNVQGTTSNVSNQSNKTLNSSTGPLDPTVDQAIPSNTQKMNGNLLEANSDNVNAKIVQTPGKSNKVSETNSNDLTGSKSKSDNVNVKVALPQQASSNSTSSQTNQLTNNTVNNNGNNVGNLVSNGNKVGPNDQKGNVIQQVGDGNLLKQQNVINNKSSSISSNKSSSTKNISPSNSSATKAATSASASPTEVIHNSTVKPQVFVEYTSFASAPTSTIASQSASITSSASSSGTPLAQANVHSGTIQVNKNQYSTQSVKLPLTSSLPLPSSSSSTNSKTLNTTTQKPRQATITYGQKGEHVVACDGKTHQPNDIIDECIKADLLNYKPNQTEACPTDMQHNIQYGISTDMLNNTNNQQIKEIQKYVRLCLTANSF